MKGVGVPGGPRVKGSHGYGRGRKNPAAAAQYRHSEQGMMARRMRNMDPQVKARNKVRRQIRKRLKTGS